MRRRTLLLGMILATLPLALPAPATSAPVTLIELRHRPASELIPLLRPHLNQGEGLSGEGFRLLLSAPPERVETLRGLVQALDRPPVPIRVTLWIATAEEVERARLHGRVVLSRREGATAGLVKAEVLTTGGEESERRRWTVTGLAGEPIRLAEGLTFPVPVAGVVENDGERTTAAVGLAYRRLQSGFVARVWVRGEQVTVEIAPRHETLHKGSGGETRHHALHTRVSGRLGEWIDLGGSQRASDTAGDAITLRAGRTARDTLHAWLRVERIGED